MNRRQLLMLLGLGGLASCTRAVEEGGLVPADVREVAVVASPDGDLSLRLGLDGGGGLFWRLSLGVATLLDWSGMGLSLEGDEQYAGLTQQEGERSDLSDSYRLSHGKNVAPAFRASRALFWWRNAKGLRVGVELHVQDDGAGWRYVIPAQAGLAPMAMVTGEATGFRLPAGAALWMQPYAARARLNPAAPSYETYHQRLDAGRLERGGGWFLPLLARVTDAGPYLLLSEAGLVDFHGLQLQAADGRTLCARLPPVEEALGEGASAPTLSLPVRTPWRVAMAGTLSQVAASTLVTDVSPPLNPLFGGEIPAWVQPGVAAWDWLVHRATGDLEAQKAHVDQAAAWGWPYVVVDGKWDQVMAPAPETAVRALADYARSRKVGIWLWYNSGGANNDRPGSPRDRITDAVTRQAEFAKIAGWGVRGVKVDFWHSDKPLHLTRMRDLLVDAARAGLMVNLHGCTIPRGWEREFPNLMSMEAVRGGETYMFPFPYALLTGDKGPGALDHVRMALVRNPIGPMDYTPVCFELARKASGISYAHSLALAAAFASGIQHYADDAIDPTKGYQPLFRDRPYIQAMMGAMPTAWDGLRILSGDPDSHAVLARRQGAEWWVAGLNGRDTVWQTDLALDFLGEGGWTLSAVTDGVEATETRWQQRSGLTARDRLPVDCLASGGFLLRFVREA
ncbi:glycoside hydrolase family 97 protein [Niveispirillum sp.]|uniref:glycoside hydrolase family 97 protein n=1 Tax=Niveispirillum sp. TaxID=1917217 RepID=UPI001B3D49C5|nr:glycoside hydrolase family 97 protein [Niveispirillum sp.]MBP7338105.1 glycoside hydrolase family 97 catalytic domain-containing protein [Niveispirillum sp.]